MTAWSDRQHGKLLQALIDIGQELSSTIDLEELLSRILRISREVFRFENAIIRLLDEDRQVLTAVASYGYGEDAVRLNIDVGRGVMGRVMLSGAPILIADLAEMPDYVPGICGARSELAVPLVARERIIGVFNVESPLPNAFSDDDVAPLMTMASQAAIAIENARLYENLRSMSSRYQELHQLNERVLKSVNLGIYTVDSDLQITSWNQAMEDMSGVAERSALGKDLFGLFPQLVEEGFQESMRRVMKKGVAEKISLEHRNLKGELRFQKRRLAPIKDGSRISGAVVIVDDITEFKRLTDQTVQSEKLAEVGRLSAGIAHEINNPLSVISYAAQLLLREEDIPVFQREIVERIDGEVDRLKALTGSLLTFSRSQGTKKRAIDINEVIRDVLRLVRYELSRHSVKLVEDYGVLPLIWADSNKIKQVFINLVMNASHVMPKGGTLTIKTQQINGAEVEAIVSDTGCGIPEDIREQIFDPFFSTKKEGEGTGLGLYICRNIINEHEGRIAVESVEGQGTSFRIDLPLADMMT